MSSLINLFKGQEINKLQTGAIAAHVNNLITTDNHFKDKFQSDPVGVLVSFGMNKSLAAGIILETIKNQDQTGSAKAGITDITDCCCTGSITINCGKDFYANMPKIDDVDSWSKLASDS